jgi:hypothetical protein
MANSAIILSKPNSMWLKNANNRAGEKSILKGSGIWGFKIELTDYRVIDDLPRAIATKAKFMFMELISTGKPVAGF